MMTNRRKIYSLNGLKAFGYICVFTAHAHLMLRNKFSVTLFFIISGFLAFYNRQPPLESIKFTNIVSYSFKHIVRLWQIHILFFLLSIVIRRAEIPNYGNWGAYAIEQILLLQSLSLQPFHYNYASWYLSCLFILYWIALPAIKWVTHTKKPIKYVTLLIIFYYIADYYVVKNAPFLDFTYWNPFYRIPDFIIGMFVCRIYEEYPLEVSSAKFDFLNSFVVVSFVLCLLVQFHLLETNNFFVLLFSIGIYILAHDRGWFCEILHSKLLQHFAKIGLEFYLCHELVIYSVEKLLYNNIFFNGYNINILIWVIAFPISITIAQITNKLKSLV